VRDIICALIPCQFNLTSGNLFLSGANNIRGVSEHEMTKSMRMKEEIQLPSLKQTFVQYRKLNVCLSSKRKKFWPSQMCFPYTLE